MQFKITGSPTRNRFWKCVSKIAQKRIKKTEDIIIDVKSVVFPSAYSILIRYETINSNEKYEIIIQGNYVPQYKIWKEVGEPRDLQSEVLDERDIEIIIRTNHSSAKKIGQ